MNRRQALPVLLAAAAFATASAGTAVAGHAAFSDAAGTHEAGIHWLADSGVTSGCGGGKFCTEDAVKRGQMATFLHRLSGNASTPPTVNADKVDGLDAEQLRGQAGPAGPPGPAGPAGPAGSFQSLKSTYACGQEFSSYDLGFSDVQVDLVCKTVTVQTPDGPQSTVEYGFGPRYGAPAGTAGAIAYFESTTMGRGYEIEGGGVVEQSRDAKPGDVAFGSWRAVMGSKDVTLRWLLEAQNGQIAVSSSATSFAVDVQQVG